MRERGRRHGACCMKSQGNESQIWEDPPERERALQRELKRGRGEMRESLDREEGERCRVITRATVKPLRRRRRQVSASGPLTLAHTHTHTGLGPLRTRLPFPTRLLRCTIQILLAMKRHSCHPLSSLPRALTPRTPSLHTMYPLPPTTSTHSLTLHPRDLNPEP
jgi:hypothetical protein